MTSNREIVESEETLMILVTGATGMFGSRITAELAKRDVPVRAMTSNPKRVAELEGPHVQPCVADMDKPETLAPALAGVDTVFVVSPMDDRVQIREANVLDAATEAGVRRIVKLFGAVTHDDDLGRLHRASVSAIKASGLEWALLSPTSVLETSLSSMIPWIEATGGIVACAGDGKVALVAVDDVARAGAAILADGSENGRDYVITGPALLTFSEICAIMSRVTGCEIGYTDVSDEELAQILVTEAGMTPEQAEIGVVCHFRAWRKGQAAVCTDTYRELTGANPTTVEQWITSNKDVFAAARAKASAGPEKDPTI